MGKDFLVKFLDVLYLKLYDFVEPISKTTSGLYIRQIICFIQINVVHHVVLQRR